MRKIFEWIEGNWSFKKSWNWDSKLVKHKQNKNKKTNKFSFGKQAVIWLTGSEKRRYHSGHQGEHTLFHQDKDEYEDNTKYTKNSSFCSSGNLSSCEQHLFTRGVLFLLWLLLYLRISCFDSGTNRTGSAESEKQVFLAHPRGNY